MYLIQKAEKENKKYVFIDEHIMKDYHIQKLREEGYEVGYRSSHMAYIIHLPNYSKYEYIYTSDSAKGDSYAIFPIKDQEDIRTTRRLINNLFSTPTSIVKGFKSLEELNEFIANK